MKISGLIAGLDVDLDGQRMDAEWLAEAVDDYLARSAPPLVTIDFDPGRVAGQCESITMTESGPVAVVEVLSTEAERLIREHSLNQMALSIRKAVIDTNDDAPYGLIKGGTIVGISLTSKAAHEGEIDEVES